MQHGTPEERGQYAPFGRGWWKAMDARYHVKELEVKAGKQGQHMTKAQLIDYIRATHIVEIFNAQYNVGDWVTPRMQVRQAAWVEDNKPVFFVEGSPFWKEVNPNVISLKV